ncbi:hypothetical protein BCR32DRAFT_280677 [Anaeromyces robustus]|uniref:Uncharacterized protein n=1 Tax=Anaeromyces robustus TaxID=1754192 RepID=A0A1Y1X3M1_9FUNG|nr:hypothetical protein BCR32DRAFT_280677 [Anaeromyces robustus]|eukprot:ORX80265.1 hypothetical protein BCR32DRAFT_280677 [Anaeromyces robustus]
MNFYHLLLIFALNFLYVVKTMPVPFSGFKFPAMLSTFTNPFYEKKKDVKYVNFFDNFFTNGGWGGNNNNGWGNFGGWGNNNNNNNKKEKNKKEKDKNNNNNFWGGDIWGLGNNNGGNGGNNGGNGGGKGHGATSSTYEFDTSNITVELYDEDADVEVVNPIN